jgi:hypothetical protein
VCGKCVIFLFSNKHLKSLIKMRSLLKAEGCVNHIWIFLSGMPEIPSPAKRQTYFKWPLRNFHARLSLLKFYTSSWQSQQL